MMTAATSLTEETGCLVDDEMAISAASMAVRLRPGSSTTPVYVMEGMEDNEEHDMVVNETFSSEEKGYKFYNAYAKSKGFGVRKEELTKKPGTDIAFRRLYVCSKEGYRARKHFEKTKRKRTPRPLSCCGCGAEKVGFVPRDLYNFFAKYKKEMIEGRDAEFQ
ncbi:hypothetical protein ACQ4PT_040899 [Festuca glaucescens]